MKCIDLNYPKLAKKYKYFTRYVNRIFRRPMFYKEFGIKESNEIWNTPENSSDVCRRIIEKEFTDLIEKYKKLDKTFDRNKTNNSKYIWVLWLQGEDKMPEIVKLCIKSIKKFAPKDKEVVVLTNKNIDQYIEFPEYILKRVKDVKITLTHFSDMVRFELLERYGGLWVDSTILTTSPIPECYFNTNLYSIIRDEPEKIKENPYYNGLTSFLIGGSKGYPLFSFMKEFFYEYQLKHNVLIDVHLINVGYAIAFDNFELIRKDVESIGKNNEKRGQLVKYINRKFDEQKWIELTDNQVFHKMDWRLEYKEENNGNITFFKKIKEIASEE